MNPPPAILYVEDEENDIFLLRLAFQEAGLSDSTITAVMDGAEAINYLGGQGKFSDRTKYPLPSLVLLDLNLPRKSGFEVIRWVRQQPQFSSLPIIVYTSSQAEIDRQNACQLGATDYTIKPSEFSELSNLARTWAQRCVLQ